MIHIFRLLIIVKLIERVGIASVQGLNIYCWLLIKTGSTLASNLGDTLKLHIVTKGWCQTMDTSNQS